MLLGEKFLVTVLAVTVAIFAISFYHFRPPRISSANDQVINPVQDSEIFDEVFQYPDVFLHNYALMEEIFKIFVYPNKDEEIFYYNERNIHGMFSSELFFHYSLLVSEKFPTCDDTEAHMFFIPLTWFQILGKGVYANGENYVKYLINEYPHWNRSKGVDHFFVTCHDTGARLSERVPLNNSITVLCSASSDSRHDLHYKYHHITLPQIRLPFVSPAGGNDIHHRETLAFWACRKNSSENAGGWDNRSEEEKFKTSKYCICDGASHVTRICITDSIHYGCVPVILYDSYELPFNDILDWTKFSVIISKDNAHRVEQVLEVISDSKFNELHNNIVKVQRHFQWNSPPERYDAFHLIIYELWLRYLADSFSDS